MARQVPMEAWTALGTFQIYTRYILNITGLLTKNVDVQRSIREPQMCKSSSGYSLWCVGIRPRRDVISQNYISRRGGNVNIQGYNKIMCIQSVSLRCSTRHYLKIQNSLEKSGVQSWRMSFLLDVRREVKFQPGNRFRRSPIEMLVKKILFGCDLIHVAPIESHVCQVKGACVISPPPWGLLICLSRIC